MLLWQERFSSLVPAGSLFLLHPFFVLRASFSLPHSYGPELLLDRWPDAQIEAEALSDVPQILFVGGLLFFSVTLCFFSFP